MVTDLVVEGHIVEIETNGADVTIRVRSFNFYCKRVTGDKFVTVVDIGDATGGCLIGSTASASTSTSTSTPTATTAGSIKSKC